MNRISIQGNTYVPHHSLFLASFCVQLRTCSDGMAKALPFINQLTTPYRSMITHKIGFSMWSAWLTFHANREESSGSDSYQATGNEPRNLRQRSQHLIRAFLKAKSHFRVSYRSNQMGHKSNFPSPSLCKAHLAFSWGIQRTCFNGFPRKLRAGRSSVKSRDLDNLVGLSAATRFKLNCLPLFPRPTRKSFGQIKSCIMTSFPIIVFFKTYPCASHHCYYLPSAVAND